MIPRHDPAGNYLPRRLHYRHGAYYHVRRTSEGVRWRRLSDSYPEALALWARLEDAGTGAQTLAQALEAYLLHRGAELSPRTLRGYRSSARRLLEVFGPCYLDEVPRPAVREWLHRRSARVSANRDLALLRAVYHHAIECGWCEANPAAGVRRHTERPRRRVCSPAERQALSAAATPLWRALLAVALLTGMRAGELRTLHRSQLTEAGIELRRPKTGAESLVLWSPALREAVEAALAAPRTGSVWVFPSRRGGPYTEDGMRSTWRRLCARAGVVGLEFRDLRRTAATDAESLEAARELLGHGGGVTGRVYRVRTRVKPVA